MEGNPNDRDPPKISYIDRGLALGLALGAGLGAALSAATDNSACLAIGIGCGMTFGIGIGSILQREHEDLGDYQYDGGQGVSENETSRVARWQASIARLRRRIFYAKHQVYSKARSLKRKEPDCSIVAASPAKGRKLREEKGTGLSLGWALAREDVLILTDGKLVLGDWHIPLDSIISATLESYAGLTSDSLVLKIATFDGVYYQFGLPDDPVWEQQTVLRLTKESGGFPTMRVVFWVCFVLACVIGYIVGPIQR